MEAVPTARLGVSLDTSVKSVVVDVVHKVRPESSVQEAVRLMIEKDIGCLIVSSQGPIGIVTERDILRKVTGRGLDPVKTRVEDIMSSPLVAVPPESTVGEAAKRMIDNQIKRVVVMDKEGTFLGLVTMSDIIRWLAKQEEVSDSLKNFLKYDVP